MGAFIITPLPHILTKKSRAAGSLCSTGVTPLHHYYGPSRHRLAFDRLPGVSGYTAYLFSTDFSMGRGRLLQLHSMSLSPCYPYHPAGVTSRDSQIATRHAAFARRQRARPPELNFSRPPMGSLTLRPGDLLTLLARALSIGFTSFVSSTDAIQATGVLTSSPVGLTPTEHASLYWTHCLPNIPSVL
jgi:hypothetical protein